MIEEWILWIVHWFLVIFCIKDSLPVKIDKDGFSHNLVLEGYKERYRSDTFWFSYEELVERGLFVPINLKV